MRPGWEACMDFVVNMLEKVQHPDRPDARFYIDAVFENFVELGGDRLY